LPDAQKSAKVAVMTKEDVLATLRAHETELKSGHRAAVRVRVGGAR
jgi:hypothetical protein